MNIKYLKHLVLVIAAVTIPAPSSAQILSVPAPTSTDSAEILSVPDSTSSTSIPYYYIRANHSNKCAQVNGATTANGAVISQWDCVNQDNVKWYFQETGDGSSYYIRAKHSNKCAQVNGATTANGAVISQWDCVNQNNVKWYLNRA